jgi:hypothetical protein
MKKYLEQRVEELELEVKLLRAKIKLNEPNNTSKYINNYPKYDPLKSAYNSSAHLDPEQSSETSFPPYPDIWGSWVEKNHLDVISEETSSLIPEWGNESKFDKTDKDFLEWLKSNEAKNAYEISKHITNKYNKAVYRPFKAK